MLLEGLRAIRERTVKYIHQEGILRRGVNLHSRVFSAAFLDHSRNASMMSWRLRSSRAFEASACALSWKGCLGANEESTSSGCGVERLSDIRCAVSEEVCCSGWDLSTVGGVRSGSGLAISSSASVCIRDGFESFVLSVLMSDALSEFVQIEFGGEKEGGRGGYGCIEAHQRV